MMPVKFNREVKFQNDFDVPIFTFFRLDSNADLNKFNMKITHLMCVSWKLYRHILLYKKICSDNYDSY